MSLGCLLEAENIPIGSDPDNTGVENNLLIKNNEEDLIGGCRNDGNPWCDGTDRRHRHDAHCLPERGGGAGNACIKQHTRSVH